MIGYPIWQIAGWTMLHYFWVGTVIGLTVLFVRTCLRAATANVRYVAALGSLLLMTIAPAIIAAIVAHDNGPWRNDTISERSANAAPETHDAKRLEDFRVSEHVNREHVINVSPRLSAANEPKAEAPVTSKFPLAAILDYAARYLPWFWIIGAPLASLLTTIGLVGAERLRRQSRPVEDVRIAELCRRLAATLKLSRRVSVAVCERIASPILVGIVRPLILLPAVALAGWDPQQIEMVLLHELVHVRRYDNLVNLLQRIVEAALFFHPLVWVVSGWVRREREHCCDEAVVSHTRQPQAYAQLLVALAGQLSRRSVAGSLLSPAHAVSSMAQPSLVGRIRRILRQEEQSMQVSPKTVGLLFVGLLGCVLMIGAYCSLPSHAEDAPAAPKPGDQAGPGVATPPAAQPVKPPEASAIEVTGQVSDDATGKPITDFLMENGHVTDLGNPSSKIWWAYGLKSRGADSGGAFTETLDLPNTGWHTRILAAGYVPEPIVLEPPKPGVTKITGLVIRMKRGRTFSGHVLDYTGKPVQDASVYLREYFFNNNITGGKVLQLNDASHEVEYAPRVVTDAQGAFTLTGIGGSWQRIAVSCAALDLWVIPVPEAGADDHFDIHLPQPGKVVVHYDIAGAPDKSILRLSLETGESSALSSWYGIGNNRGFPIQQGKELVIDNVTPGVYAVSREKELGGIFKDWPPEPILDYRDVKVESGKTAVVDFVRHAGAPINGQVVGLNEGEVAAAKPTRVIVTVVPANVARGEVFKQYDIVAMESGDKPMDGKFTTERIPPGKYKVRAEVFLPRREYDLGFPAFVGETPVTVPEQGGLEPIKIELKSSGSVPPAAAKPAQSDDHASAKAGEPTQPTVAAPQNNSTALEGATPGSGAPANKVLKMTPNGAMYIESMEANLHILLPAYDYLVDPSNRAQFNISTEQQKKLRDVSAKFVAEYSELNKTAQETKKTLPPDEWKAKLKELLAKDRLMRAAIRREIEHILTPEQVSAIRRRKMHAEAFNLGFNLENPKLTKNYGFNLSKEQEEQLASLEKETMEKDRVVYEDYGERMLGILNNEQREKLAGQFTDADIKGPVAGIPSADMLLLDLDFMPPKLLSFLSHGGANLTVFPKLADPEFCKAIGLNAVQEKQLLTISGKLQSAAQEISSIYEHEPSGKLIEKLSPEKKQARLAEFDAKRPEYQQKLKTLGDTIIQQVEATLTPQQLAALKTLALKHESISALHDMSMPRGNFNDFSVSKEQEDKLRQLEGDAFVSSFNSGREAGEKAIKLLSPEQQKKLEEDLDRGNWLAPAATHPDDPSGKKSETKSTGGENPATPAKHSTGMFEGRRTIDKSGVIREDGRPIGTWGVDESNIAAEGTER